ncbi:MAG: 2-phospho-L-lactate guanylyltransferase [Anaerolineales bacterium]
MAIWAIVPVKPLRRGKSRLSDVLSTDERAELNQYLLEHTIQTLNDVPEIENVLVVSRDPSALSIARELGSRTVQENGSPGLNLALSRATQVAKTYETRGVLILPADLPKLSADDIHAMLKHMHDPPVVVVAPDRDRLGTNALLVCPAGLIEYDFGPDSFERHCQQAREKGVRLVVCELPSLALDLDEPDDLALMDLDIKTDPEW